jgi:hypothetical protein
VKRLYFLVGIAAAQILLGSLTMLHAAEPIRMSQDVAVRSGSYYGFEFGFVGTGWLSGNLSELEGRPFDLLVFDDRGYASFRDGSNSVPSLFEANGTAILFDLTLPGWGAYYVVAVDLPARQNLQVHLDLIVGGLKPIETIVALIVLAGGLALLGASLTLSVWSWRQAPPAPAASADLSSDPSPDSAPGAQDPVADPHDDKTRIY